MATTDEATRTEVAPSKLHNNLAQSPLSTVVEGGSGGEVHIPPDMQRVVVLGSTGSGKSTLARAVADILGCRHIELDALRFLPKWQVRPNDEFHDLVEQQTRDGCWVVDGNYGIARDVTWTRADTALFLDYPLRRVLWQLTKRIFKRAITREELWNTGNRENVWKHFIPNDESLYYWAIKNHQRRRREYPKLFVLPEYAHLRTFTFYSPVETERWLTAFRQVARSGPVHSSPPHLD